jgi:hypothetical protein
MPEPPWALERESWRIQVCQPVQLRVSAWLQLLVLLLLK